MEKLEFKITIDASREKVWDVLWGEDTYPVWTAPFSEGSKVETDWQEGSKILFLDASDRGMVSRVKENRPNEYMGIEHLGYYDKGNEVYDTPEVKSWAGSTENYTLLTVDGKTELTVDNDTSPDHKEMFEKIWPKALDIVKELAEN
ncbi:SRPBCC family protein [Flavobacterium sp. PLA-1-15]|uniref:SRPBCC family protein n=1 Tax=Flavobacterium sp. PLA-1-15 TaxID=3380533 RepID=UPI003B810AF4